MTAPDDVRPERAVSGGSASGEPVSDGSASGDPLSGEPGSGGPGEGIAAGGARATRVAPSSLEEIAAVLNDAANDGAQVMPVGTEVDIRPFPRPDGVRLLETSALGGVQTYEPADLTLTVGAGTTLAEIDETLGAHGQWLPFDPPRAEERTIGGIVATGATGALWSGYGAPRDHVLGATVVTGDGATLRLGGRVMKNVAGFDLLRLMIGSRGTLAVVASATVRVFPRPAVDGVYAVEDEEPIVVGLGQELSMARLLPAAAGVASNGEGGARLTLRIHGPAAGVDSDVSDFSRHLGRLLSAEEGADAAAVLARLQDNPVPPGGVGLRASALPSSFTDLWSALRAALPDASLAGDPLSGRIRAAVPTVPAADVVALRDQVAELGGTLILTHGPDDFVREVGVHGGRPDDLGLASALRDRFDARGVLVDQALYG